MKLFVHRLEPRHLLAIDLPAGLFSQPQDTYTLSIGTSITNLELRAVSHSISRNGNVLSDTGFQLVAYSGPTSITLLQLTTSGAPIQTATITQKTASGATRSTWLLRSVTLSSFSQSAGQGESLDNFTIEYGDRMTWTLARFDSFGTPIGSQTFEYSKTVGNVTQAPAVIETEYMSTSGVIANTLEISNDAPRSQLPLLGFSYGIGV